MKWRRRNRENEGILLLLSDRLWNCLKRKLAIFKHDDHSLSPFSEFEKNLLSIILVWSNSFFLRLLLLQSETEGNHGTLIISNLRRGKERVSPFFSSGRSLPIFSGRHYDYRPPLFYTLSFFRFFESIFKSARLVTPDSAKVTNALIMLHTNERITRGTRR